MKIQKNDLAILSLCNNVFEARYFHSSFFIDRQCTDELVEKISFVQHWIKVFYRTNHKYKILLANVLIYLH